MHRAAQTIIRWEWLILLILLPFLLFPSGWTGLLLLVIPALWIVRKAATGHFVPSTPFDNTILALLVALLISMAAVFDIDSSFPKIAGLIISIAIFYAAVQFCDQINDGEIYLLGAIFLAGSGMVLVGLLGSSQLAAQSLLSPFFDLLPASLRSMSDRLGVDVNPNELAGILGWTVPLLAAVVFGLGLDMWRSGWSFRFLHLILVILLLGNSLLLFAVGSRGGILSVVVAALGMLAIRYRLGRWFLLLLGGAVVLLGTFFDLGTLLVGGSSATVDLGLQARVEIWSRALAALADFPLTGMGLNGFRQVVHVLYPLFSVSPDFDIGHAHNHLLQAGLDLGLLGLTAYLGIWVAAGGLLWIGWKNASRHLDRVLIVGLSGSLVAGWVFGIFDAIALGAKPGFIWWLILSMLVAVFVNVRKRISG